MILSVYFREMSAPNKRLLSDSCSQSFMFKWNHTKTEVLQRHKGPSVQIQLQGQGLGKKEEQTKQHRDGK